MKDIVISARRIRTELCIGAICLAVACLLNVGAVIAYGRPWFEILSQAGYVVVIAVFIYLIVLVFRLVIYAVRRIIRKHN